MSHTKLEDCVIGLVRGELVKFKKKIIKKIEKIYKKFVEIGLVRQS
jgi:hypothetical protein